MDSLTQFVDNINLVTRDGKRLVTINAIGFRTGFESSRMRFALAYESSARGMEGLS